MNTIWVPETLIETAESEFSNIKTIENHLLFWHYIDSWPYTDTSDDDWRQINDKSFKNLVSNSNQRANIRRWLEETGYLKIKKYRRDDGELINWYIPDKESCKYVPLYPSELVEYQLISKQSWLNSLRFTENEELCMATREMLGLLLRIPEKTPNYENKEAEKRKKNRDLSSLNKLSTNTGNVKRGHQVDRLFSPWVCASSEVRKCFLLDGGGMSCLDLKAAHPTLIAQISGDQKLAEDCTSDALYFGIAKMLGSTRDSAKKAFMAYGYGKNRRDGRGNMAAFQVQQWMRKNYPIAASYITNEKTAKDHAEFSIALQNLEAEIFVEGIFRELNNKDVPALTVHDAVYCRSKDIGQVEQITRRHIEKIIQ